MDTKKSMKKLTKLELLEMLAEQETEIQKLKHQLKEKDKLLKQRRLQMKEFGNIAQASLALNGVFEAAQRAADQYVESVKAMVDQKLKRDGTRPFVSETDRAMSSGEGTACSDAETEEQQEFTVEAILQNLVDYELLRECTDSMEPKQEPKHREREDQA